MPPKVGGGNLNISLNLFLWFFFYFLSDPFCILFIPDIFLTCMVPLILLFFYHFNLSFSYTFSHLFVFLKAEKDRLHIFFSIEYSTFFHSIEYTFYSPLRFNSWHLKVSSVQIKTLCLFFSLVFDAFYFSMFSWFFFFAMNSPLFTLL